MIQWLQNNIGTVIVCAIVAIMFVSIAVKLIRDKKQGKAGCSCGCSGCAMKDSCHSKK